MPVHSCDDGLTETFFRVILICNHHANPIKVNEVICVHFPKNTDKEDIVAWPIY
jgi:hypothetical protein